VSLHMDGRGVSGNQSNDRDFEYIGNPRWDLGALTIVNLNIYAIGVWAQRNNVRDVEYGGNQGLGYAS
jgi:hypothetical protein